MSLLFMRKCIVSAVIMTIYSVYDGTGHYQRWCCCRRCGHVARFCCHKPLQRKFRVKVILICFFFPLLFSFQQVLIQWSFGPFHLLLHVLHVLPDWYHVIQCFVCLLFFFIFFFVWCWLGFDGLGISWDYVTVLAIMRASESALWDEILNLGIY